MNFKLHIIMFIAIQGVAFSCIGQGEIPLWWNNVNFLDYVANSHRNNAENILNKFERPVGYSIVVNGNPSTSTNINFSPDGNSRVDVDVKLLVEEAINEWRNALIKTGRITGNVFTQLPDGDQYVRLRIYFDTNYNQGELYGELRTLRNQPMSDGDSGKGSVRIYVNTFRDLFKNDVVNAERLRKIKKNIQGLSNAPIPNSYIIRLLLRDTIKHEIGHYVGFAHPNHSDRPRDVGVVGIRSLGRTFDTPPSGVPIMLAGGNSSGPPGEFYWNRVFQNSQGPDYAYQILDIASITISLQEQLALDSLTQALSDQCLTVSFPGNIPRDENFAKNNNVSSNECPVYRYYKIRARRGIDFIPGLKSLFN